MPWSIHIEQWMEDFDIKGTKPNNCTDEEIFNLLSEHWDFKYRLIVGEEGKIPQCRGFEFSITRVPSFGKTLEQRLDRIKLECTWNSRVPQEHPLEQLGEWR